MSSTAQQCPLDAAAYRAANLILDTIEEALNLQPCRPGGRDRTVAAIVGIFKHCMCEALREMAAAKTQEDQ